MRTIVHRHFLSLRESFVVAIWCLSIHTAFGQGDASTWKKHTINDQSPFEAAGASDFNGDGRMDVFSGDSWYAAPDWTRHKVREVPRGTNPHYHEDFADQPLDVNGDGRIDIITPTGWFEQPVKRDDAWTLQSDLKLGAASIPVLVHDFDGDGDNDIVWGMGHDFGLFWMKQTGIEDGKISWAKEEIDMSFSQVHVLHLADFDNDGQMEFVTGKRVYAHASEPGATDAPCVFIYKFERKSSRWTKETVYLGEPAPAAPLNPEQRDALKDFRRGSAGTGLQMSICDIDRDGDLDIVAPGKSGLYWFENPLAAR